MKVAVKLKYRFEILIPLADNRGRPFPWARVHEVALELRDRFEGCRTQSLAPYLGMWKYRGKIYQEGFVLIVAEAPRSDDSLNWMLTYKQRLKKQFRQIDVYLAVSEVMWL